MIEVMVGLSLGALVLLLSHQLAQAVQAATSALVKEGRSMSREQNGRQLLADLLQSVDPAGASGAFEGRPAHMVFGAWAQGAEGWFAPQRVFVGQRGATLTVTVGNKAMVIRDSVESVEFDYLVAQGSQSPWYREWSTTAQAPLAVRLRLTTLGRGRVSDTVLFLVRGAG